MRITSKNNAMKSTQAKNPLHRLTCAQLFKCLDREDFSRVEKHACAEELAERGVYGEYKKVDFFAVYPTRYILDKLYDGITVIAGWAIDRELERRNKPLPYPDAAHRQYPPEAYPYAI